MTDAPLIVGAGPTGLAAALFLSRRGIASRIIDSAAGPVTTSRALGVNPRTLAILKGTGVEDEITAEGLPISTFHLHSNRTSVARVEIPYKAIGAEQPMHVLPQARTEALLTRALAERGIEVERGKALTALSQDETGVTVTAGGETIRASILLGADGAHSATRHALNIAFPGDAMDADWRLMDVELTGPDPDAAWIDFREDGPFVALPFNNRLWRLIGFGEPLQNRIPQGWTTGKVEWISDFHVSNRLAERMNVGRVCLAGDAAHIHSPIGGRGMNLGIEDAFIWAHCAEAYLKGDAGKLAVFGDNRHAVDALVVQHVKRLTATVSATGAAATLVRRLTIPLLAGFMSPRVAVARMMLGLDHPLVLP